MSTSSDSQNRYSVHSFLVWSKIISMLTSLSPYPDVPFVLFSFQVKIMNVVLTISHGLVLDIVLRPTFLVSAIVTMIMWCWRKLDSYFVRPHRLLSSFLSFNCIVLNIRSSEGLDIKMFSHSWCPFCVWSCILMLIALSFVCFSLFISCGFFSCRYRLWSLPRKYQKEVWNQTRTSSVCLYSWFRSCFGRNRRCNVCAIRKVLHTGVQHYSKTWRSIHHAICVGTSFPIPILELNQRWEGASKICATCWNPVLIYSSYIYIYCGEEEGLQYHYSHCV